MMNSVRKAKRLAKLILEANKTGMTYREMQRICGVKAGTINRFAKAKGTWLPKDKQILLALGLVSIRVRQIIDMPKKELLWRLENREITRG